MTDLTFTGLTVSVVRLDDEGRYSFGVLIDGAFVEFHSRPVGGVDAAIAQARAALAPPAPEPPAEPVEPPAPPAQQLSDEGAAAEQAEPAPDDEQAEQAADTGAAVAEAAPFLGETQATPVADTPAPPAG